MGSSRFPARWLDSLVRLVALGALLVFVLFPLLWLFLMSLKRPRDLIANPPLFVFRPIIDNYAAVLGLDINFARHGVAAPDVDFLGGYGHSLAICAGALVIALAIGTPIAYVLARFPFRWREQLAFAVLGYRFVPDLAVLIPFYILFLRLRLFDTLLGLMLAYQTFLIPFLIWSLRGYFQDLPREVEEAAFIDGNSRIGVFFRIALPLTAPGLAATAGLAFIFAWNNFSFGLILTQLQAQPVTVTMLGYITYNATLWGQLAAAAMLIIVPELLVAILIQRYIVRGLTYGIH